MALDPRKRQKKLAKKTARRKKRALAVQKESSFVRNPFADLKQLAVAMNSPIHQCLVPTGLFETGIGNVIVSRRLSNDHIATGVFLVDVFCLGIKKAFLKILSPDEYEYMVEKIGENETLKPVAPDYARKLVEKAEAYAGKLGFSPHPDYRRARQIFGNINMAACTTEFEFGKDGKPFFIAGPHDSPARRRQICDTLLRSCGPGGFHYLIPVSSFEEVYVDDEDYDEEDVDENNEKDED